MKPVHIKDKPHFDPEDKSTQVIPRTRSNRGIAKERIMRVQTVTNSTIYVKLPKKLSIEMNVFPNCCLIIGRAPEAPKDAPLYTTLALDSSEISRTHLALFMENESIFVQDMNSSNGSFITTGGVRTPMKPNTPALLGKDAVVEFGEAVLNLQSNPFSA